MTGNELKSKIIEAIRRGAADEAIAMVQANIVLPKEAADYLGEIMWAANNPLAPRPQPRRL